MRNALIESEFLSQADSGAGTTFPALSDLLNALDCHDAARAVERLSDEYDSLVGECDCLRDEIREMNDELHEMRSELRMMRDEREKSDLKAGVCVPCPDQNELPWG